MAACLGYFAFLRIGIIVASLHDCGSVPVAQLWLKISRSLQVALLPKWVSISFVIASGPGDFFTFSCLSAACSSFNVSFLYKHSFVVWCVFLSGEIWPWYVVGDCDDCLVMGWFQLPFWLQIIPHPVFPALHSSMACSFVLLPWVWTCVQLSIYLH